MGGAERRIGGRVRRVEREKEKMIEGRMGRVEREIEVGRVEIGIGG